MKNPPNSVPTDALIPEDAPVDRNQGQMLIPNGVKAGLNSADVAADCYAQLSAESDLEDVFTAKRLLWLFEAYLKARYGAVATGWRCLYTPVAQTVLGDRTHLGF